MAQTSTRECPFCREPIHPEAIKCPHCLSLLGTAGIDGPVALPDVEGFDGPSGNGEVVARWHSPTTVSVPGPGGVWTCTRYWKCDEMGWDIVGPNGQKRFTCMKGHWAMECRLV